VMALGTANHQAAPCSPDAQAPPTQAINLKQTVYAGAPVSLIQAYSPVVPRFEIWSDPSTIASILAELHDTHVVHASAADLEALRILEARPKFGQDIRDRDLPQETAQTHALHFNKGCYLGQEIVERIRSRGQVHRAFTAFTLTGELPTLPAPLEAQIAGQTRPAGELTSAIQIGDTLHALGYLRREFATQPLTYPGGAATPKNPSL